MAKDWVTLGGWLKYELRVLKRAWRELNIVTLICTLLGTGAGYSTQYLTGLKKAHEAFSVGGLMLGGALLGFLLNFILLFLTAHAKLAAEAESRIRQLEGEVAALKKQAEEDRALTRRRGSAPFLKPVNEDWVQLFVRSGPGKIQLVHFNYPGLLCATTPEVKDLPDGELVYFPVENHGRAAPAVYLALDGKPIALEQEPEVSSSHGYYYFTYPYEKAKHGKEELLAMSFETTDGQHDTHKYLVVHGCRVLKRIDPALP